jgi:transposase-like protein
MRRYSEADKSEMRRRKTSSHRQSITQISVKLDVNAVALHNWRKAWRLQGEVVPTSEK